MCKSEKDYKDPFNFRPNKDWSKKPTHRVNYWYKCGTTVSTPAIFLSDTEARDTAINNAEDAIGIRVTRYKDKRKNGLWTLEIVYEEGVAIDSYPK